MAFERQPDNLPTNKAATVAVLAPAGALYVAPIIAELWPQVAPALVAGPAVTEALAWLAGALAALAVAWFVPDRAGV